MATETQRKAINKYLEKKEQVRFWVDKGEHDRYKQLAEAAGCSLAELMKRAVKEYAENHDL